MNTISLVVALTIAIIASIVKRANLRARSEAGQPIGESNPSSGTAPRSSMPARGSQQNQQQLKNRAMMARKKKISPTMGSSEQQAAKPISPSQVSKSKQSSSEESIHPVLRDFDLERAVIYAEILEPKFKSYE